MGDLKVYVGKSISLFFYAFSYCYFSFENIKHICKIPYPILYATKFLPEQKKEIFSLFIVIFMP